jgi:uncharacterized membrane protein YsdA (DUF1294 family)
VIVVLIWLACSVCAYLIFRADWRKTFNEWTIGERRTTILICVFGPFALFSALITYPYGDTERRRALDKRPASW